MQIITYLIQWIKTNYSKLRFYIINIIKKNSGSKIQSTENAVFFFFAKKRQQHSENKLFKFVKLGSVKFFKDKNMFFNVKKTHNFYIAPPFPFSILASISTGILLYSTVKFLHSEKSFEFFKLNLIIFLGTTLYWLYLLAKQATKSTDFSKLAQKNLTLGIVLFIISEVIIFFGIFWAFFHSSLAPSTDIGAVWPSSGLQALEWWKWPTLGTFILVYSGFSVNVFFYTLKNNNSNAYFNIADLSIDKQYNSSESNTLVTNNLFYSVDYNSFEESCKQDKFVKWSTMNTALIHTLIFGFLFLLCQKHEYAHASFSGSDGIYGTVFFGITGLHGFHVFLGFVLLLIVFFRLQNSSFFSTSPHTSVSGAVWYWHFVDVVWLFVYGLVYYWGCSSGINLALLC